MRISQHKSGAVHQAGVTLIETVVSLAIFGVSFFSLYAGISMGFSIIGNARENLRATQILVEKTETIRLYSWDQINTTEFIPATFTEAYKPGGSEEDGGLHYQGRVVISDGPAGLTYSADLKTVTITLTWTSGGRAQSRTMTTYVARNGLQDYIY
jgi:prepilin-type N-terminal cleavage/methylation domain-containing protein